jgi:beta-lactamase class A
MQDNSMNINDAIMKLVNSSKYEIGFYIKDKNSNKVIKYNENNVFETASCIKVFILVEYFKQVYENKISINDYFEYTKDDNKPGLNSGIISSLDYGLKLTSKDYATLMIIYSDNIATNKIIKYLGIENINNTIKELGFNNTDICNELDIVKYHKFGNTTPYEYAKIFEMLLDGKVINETISNNCLEVLKKQKHNDMIVKYLPINDLLFKGEETSNIKYIASKSGAIVWENDEIKNARNDGGILSTVYGDLIISIFISNLDDLSFNYDNKGIELGGKICKIVYDDFIKNKGVNLNE